MTGVTNIAVAIAICVSVNSYYNQLALRDYNYSNLENKSSK